MIHGTEDRLQKKTIYVSVRGRMGGWRDGARETVGTVGRGPAREGGGRGGDFGRIL